MNFNRSGADFFHGGPGGGGSWSKVVKDKLLASVLSESFVLSIMFLFHTD